MRAMPSSIAGRRPSSLSPARMAGAVAVLLVAGCAGWPPPGPVPPTVVPPQRIERLVALLDAEWRRWGGRVVSLDEPAGACLLQPEGGCVEVFDGCGDEQSAALCAVVDGYWLQTPPFVPRQRCERTDVCTTRWPSELPRDGRAPPWSAAFVSAMMARAGFAASELPPSPTHAAYVAAARDGRASAYEALPTPAHPAPGDLVCAMRGDSPLTPAELHRIDGGLRPSPMHCDLVVAVDRALGVAEAIGGNVQQTVAKTVVRLDADGRVAFDANAHRRWIVVLRARRALPEPWLP